MDTLPQALAFAATGLRVFPLRPRQKTPCEGWLKWQALATSDADQVRAMWARAAKQYDGAQPNIGIAMGFPVPSGLKLVALDVDERPHLRGTDILAALETELGPLPDTVRVLTGSGNGSLHLYFLVPAAVELPNKKLDDLGGVQLKAHHGYVLGAGSVHPDTGLAYVFEAGAELAGVEGGETFPAALPDRWLEYCQRRPGAAEPTHEPVAAGRLEHPGDHLPPWNTLLAETGATYVGSKWIDGEPRQAWLRPDGWPPNPPTSDHSAVVLEAGLWVYTTAWPTKAGTTLQPSEARGNHTYSKIGYWAAVHHGDDSPSSIRRAAAELAQAYGLKRPAVLHPSLRHPSTALFGADAALQGPWAPLAGAPDASGALPAPAADATSTADDPLGSWRLIDLEPYVNGDHDTPTPTLLHRLDGQALFYRGAVNGLHGDSGIGKSWLATLAVMAEAMAGRVSLVLDYEDTPLTIVARLRALGMPAHLIGRLVLYVRPQDPLTQLAVDYLHDNIRQHDVALVVIDSVGEALNTEGLNEDKDNEVGPWLTRFVRRLADLGPAVLLVDHGTKSADNPLFQSGSKRKRAALTGSSFLVTEDSESPLAKSNGNDPHVGRLHLTTAKDRHGNHVRGKPAGTLRMTANPDGTNVAELFAPAAHSPADPDYVRVTLCAQAAVNACKREGRPLGQNSLEGLMQINAKHELKRAGISLAVDRGALEVAAGPNRSKLYAFVAELPISGERYGE